MTEFYDSNMASAFEKGLTKEGIAFQKEGNRFYYRESDYERADYIANNVLKELRPKFSFLFNKIDLYLKVKKTFDSEGLKYEVYTTDNETGLSWSKSENLRARKIIREVTGIPL